jgi:hypothetical protein
MAIEIIQVNYSNRGWQFTHNKPVRPELVSVLEKISATPVRTLNELTCEVCDSSLSFETIKEGLESIGFMLTTIYPIGDAVFERHSRKI